MATRSASAPLTFDLPTSLIAKIDSGRRKYGLKTASEACKPARDPHRQLSVRLGANQRAMLKRYAKKKNASVGELLRFALEALPAAKPKSR